MILILILIFRLFVIHEPSFSGLHGIRLLPQMMSPNGEPDNLVPKLHYQPCPAQPAKPDVKTGSAIFYFFSDSARAGLCAAPARITPLNGKRNYWNLGNIQAIFMFQSHPHYADILGLGELCGSSVGRTNYVYRPHLCYVFTFTEETGFGGSRYDKYNSRLPKCWVTTIKNF